MSAARALRPFPLTLRASESVCVYGNVYVCVCVCLGMWHTAGHMQMTMTWPGASCEQVAPRRVCLHVINTFHFVYGSLQQLAYYSKHTHTHSYTLPPALPLSRSLSRWPCECEFNAFHLRLFITEIAKLLNLVQLFLLLFLSLPSTRSLLSALSSLRSLSLFAISLSLCLNNFEFCTCCRFYCAARKSMLRNLFRICRCC